MELVTEKQIDYIKVLIGALVSHEAPAHWNENDKEKDHVRHAPFQHIFKIAVLPADMTEQQASALIEELKSIDARNSPKRAIEIMDDDGLLPLLGKTAAELALRFLDAEKPYAMYMELMAESEAQETTVATEEIKSVNDTYIELMTEDEYSFRSAVYSEGFDPKASFDPRWVVAVEKALLEGITSIGTIRILQANQRLDAISFSLKPSKSEYWELKHQLAAQANILMTDAQRIIDVSNRPTKRSAEHFDNIVNNVDPNKYWGLLGAEELRVAVIKYRNRPNEQYALDVAKAMNRVAGTIGKAIANEPEGLSDVIPVSAD